MHSAKQYQWHKIAAGLEEIHFGANGLTELEVEGKMICLAKHQNTISATAQKCPHAGAKMCDGHVDALGNMVCPLHRYKFSTKNGRNVSGEGYYLKIFPVEIRPEGVFIGFEQNNLTNWLK